MNTRRFKTVLIALAALLTSAGAVEAAQLGLGARDQLRQRLAEKRAEEERPIDLQAIAPAPASRPTPTGPTRPSDWTSTSRRTPATRRS